MKLSLAMRMYVPLAANSIVSSWPLLLAVVMALFSPATSPLAMVKVTAGRDRAQKNRRVVPNQERNDKRSFTLIVLPSPFVATAWPPGKLQLGKGSTQKKSAADEQYLYMRLRNVLLKRPSKTKFAVQEMVRIG